MDGTERMVEGRTKKKTKSEVLGTKTVDPW